MTSTFAFGNRDPYSTDNITSPPVSSSTSAHGTRRAAFHSPAGVHVMASSPLASLSANAIARKRQRSADETDEINLFRPKRQPFVTCLGSPTVEGERPTPTDAAVSYTSSAASQAAPSKHDSGFHEDEQHKVVDDNQDKNSSPALPVLGEESKSVAIPSASVAAPIRGDNAGRITVEEGSTEDISTVEGANSVDTLKVVREGYAATPVLDEVNPEPTPTIEGDDAENKHVIHNSIECGSTELHVPVAVKVDGDSINVNDSTQPPRPPAPRGKPRASSGSIGSLHRVVLASVLDEPPQAEADSSQSTSPKEFAVSHVSSHRPAADGSDRLELLVHWAGHGEEPTWEPEEQVHLGARDTVAKYWAGVEGGRVAVRPYEVFAIRGSKTTGKGPRKSLHLRVEWLGYVEETWEPVARFSKDQPKLVERYFELVGRPQKPQYNR